VRKMELTELTPLLDSGVTVVFAVIVWKELHAIREQLAGTLGEIAERLAAIETSAGIRE
jgi:hypothetical protein